MLSSLNCPLCSRRLSDQGYNDDHHLIPRSLGGKETVLMHRVCHQKIHSLFTEKELKKNYFTIELLLANSEVQKFIKWIKNKSPEFHDTSIQSSRKRKY